MNLKGNENKELNHVPPNISVLLKYKEKPISWFFNIGFLFGLQQGRNYETEIYEHWEKTFSFEYFKYIFYVE